MKKIKVFAPASVANMGCGFDVMGMALEGVGDEMEVGIEEGYGLTIINESGVKLPADIERNVITPAVIAFLDAYRKQMKVEVRILKKILPGSGIGSSAASSVAAVYGLNELLGRPYTLKELIPFAMEGERLISGVAHADNVGPSLLGGIVFIRGYAPLDVIPLPLPASFCCTVVHPHIMISTKTAREVLPEKIPLREAITQWGNVGGLVAGLLLGDMELVGRSMKDVVAEPYRKHFIPLYDEMKAELLQQGALAVNISSSGPSVFALSDSMERAGELGQRMKAHFEALRIEADIYVSDVAGKGARMVGEIIDVEGLKS